MNAAHLWLTSYTLPPGQPAHWQIGPLAIWLQAHPGEWRVHHSSVGVGPLRLAETEVPIPADAPISRFASARLAQTLHMGARCPDRPVVVRPEVPFSLLAGDRIDLFVGAPVWITLSPDDGAPVLEVPVVRPTDTWIGPDTRHGSVGYSLRTSSRTDPSLLRCGPGRSITRLTLINNTRNSLDFQRVVLPMPALALWADAGQLWTDAVTYELGADGEGQMHVAPAAGTLVSKPRQPRDNNALSRAWATLFG